MQRNEKTKALRAQISKLVEEYATIALASNQFVPGATIIPPSGKLIDAAELKNTVEASLDGWLTTGRFNFHFEKKLATFLGVKHLLTVNSGSSANLVAFSTLTSPKLGERAIKPGDEVIGVAAGFPTTVNPILQFGSVPVFVDVDPLTHNIDASKIEAAISSKTKAIMLAHSLGNPFNLDVVTTLCKKYKLERSKTITLLSISCLAHTGMFSEKESEEIQLKIINKIIKFSPNYLIMFHPSIIDSRFEKIRHKFAGRIVSESLPYIASNIDIFITVLETSAEQYLLPIGAECFVFIFKEYKMEYGIYNDYCNLHLHDIEDKKVYKDIQKLVKKNHINNNKSLFPDSNIRLFTDCFLNG